MPRFDTPEPIRATIELGIGDVRITAGPTGETVVQVRPSDKAVADDVTAAEQTRVDYSDGRLLVKAPKTNWRQWSPSSTGGSVDVTVDLPAGSHVQGIGGMAAFRGEGRLGECRIHNQTDATESPASSEETVEVRARTGYGDIVIHRSATHPVEHPPEERS